MSKWDNMNISWEWILRVAYRSDPLSADQEQQQEQQPKSTIL